ncbi:hypothetical protein PC128_g8130 [Phytophthora cactorum]|nr:hypothetical protein PC128_g8130 [Phytophthora cactorum]
MASMARIVIPGYGLCTVKIGDGAVFIHDNAPQILFQEYQSRCIRELTIYNLVVEDDSVLLDLLAKIGKGWHTLWITKLVTRFRKAEEGLDLSVLAAICPQLEELMLFNFDVSLSEYNEALRRWPVKKMRLCETLCYPSLTRCLRDHTCLMATNLVQLHVTSSGNTPFSTDEIREIESHGGELLPLTKEKLPIRMKAALLSVVAGFRERSPCQAFDAYIVGLIFRFAATPVRRLVRCA